MNGLSDQLSEVLRRRKAVAYVGAGFSMACGMPNWVGLLNRIVDAVKESETGRSLGREALRKAIEIGDLPLAASLARKSVSCSELNSIVQDTFGNETLAKCDGRSHMRMSNRLSNLVNGRWAGIITTNYDCLIETAIAQQDLPYVRADNSLRFGSLLFHAGRRPFFCKLHGSLDGQLPVLTTEDYERVYLRQNQVRHFLHSIMMQYTIVFIGCSLTDVVVELRRDLMVEYGGLLPDAFALLPMNEVNELKSDWLREASGIRSILYNSENDHFAVDKMLKEFVNGNESDSGPTVDELRFASPAVRLECVGEESRRLLAALAQRGETEKMLVLATDFVEPNASGSATSAVTIGERGYRLLFLVAIGLVDELRKNSVTYYQVPNEVRRHLFYTTE